MFVCFLLKWSALLTLAIDVSHKHQVAYLMHGLRLYCDGYSGEDGSGVVSGVLVLGSA